MKYLVTDPYDTIPNHEDWMAFLDKTSYCEDLPENTVIPNYGKVLELSPTTGGDGSINFNGQSIGVDSGTVCLIEVADDFHLNESFGAVLNTLELATKAFNKAQAI